MRRGQDRFSAQASYSLHLSPNRRLTPLLQNMKFMLLLDSECGVMACCGCVLLPRYSRMDDMQEAGRVVLPAACAYWRHSSHALGAFSVWTVNRGDCGSGINGCVACSRLLCTSAVPVSAGAELAKTSSFALCSSQHETHHMICAIKGCFTVCDKGIARAILSLAVTPPTGTV